VASESVETSLQRNLEHRIGSRARCGVDILNNPLLRYRDDVDSVGFLGRREECCPRAGCPSQSASPRLFSTGLQTCSMSRCCSHGPTGRQVQTVPYGKSCLWWRSASARTGSTEELVRQVGRYRKPSRDGVQIDPMRAMVFAPAYFRRSRLENPDSAHDCDGKSGTQPCFHRT
jgi:hypothetical protein